MIGIHPQQIGDVPAVALIELQPLLVTSPFEKVSHVVLHLCKAVDFVFPGCFLAALEDQADLGSFEQSRTKVRACTSHAQIQTVAIRKDAVARVQPQCLGFARFDGKREIKQVAERPERIFHLNVDGKVIPMGRLDLQGGQVQRNPI